MLCFVVRIPRNSARAEEPWSTSDGIPPGRHYPCMESRESNGAESSSDRSVSDPEPRKVISAKSLYLTAVFFWSAGLLSHAAFAKSAAKEPFVLGAFGTLSIVGLASGALGAAAGLALAFPARSRTGGEPRDAFEAGFQWVAAALTGATLANWRTAASTLEHWVARVAAGLTTLGAGDAVVASTMAGYFAVGATVMYLRASGRAAWVPSRGGWLQRLEAWLFRSRAGRAEPSTPWRQ